MSREGTDGYRVVLKDGLGNIVISSHVVAVISGIAALEVEGVALTVGNLTRELISKIGVKNLAKGVKVDILGDVASIEIALEVKYGFNVMTVSRQVQEKVKATVQNMTGLTVADVNVRVAGVRIGTKQG